MDSQQVHDPETACLPNTNAGVEIRHATHTHVLMSLCSAETVKVRSCIAPEDIAHAGFSINSVVARRKASSIGCLESLRMPYPGSHMHAASAGGKIWDGELAASPFLAISVGLQGCCRWQKIKADSTFWSHA